MGLTSVFNKVTDPEQVEAARLQQIELDELARSGKTGYVETSGGSYYIPEGQYDGLYWVPGKPVPIATDFNSAASQQALPEGVNASEFMPQVWEKIISKNELKQGDPGTTTVYVDYSSSPPKVYLDPNAAPQMRWSGGHVSTGPLKPVTVMDPVAAGFKQPTEGWERFWNQVFSGSIQEEYVPDWFQGAFGKDETNFDYMTGANPFVKNWGFNRATLMEKEDSSFLKDLGGFIGTIAPFVAPMLGPVAGSLFGLANAAINKDPFAAVGALAGLGGGTGLLSQATSNTVRGLSGAAGAIVNKNPVSALGGLATAAGAQGLLAPDTASAIGTFSKIGAPLYSALTYDAPSPQSNNAQPQIANQMAPTPVPTSPTASTAPNQTTPINTKTPYVPGLLSYVLQPPQPYYQPIPTFR